MIQELSDGMSLYHGSYCKVTFPDLAYCSKYKDFGRGFYLTTNISQAKNFAKISTRKALRCGKADSNLKEGVVSCFTFKTSSSLKVCIFKNADKDWLHCIAAHRNKNFFQQLVKTFSSYDIICGKVANDNTNATITAYLANLFGEAVSETADELCIRLLLPERLHDQYCFRSIPAIQCLTFVGSEPVELKHE